MGKHNDLVVVAADPPWRMGDKLQGERGAAHKYPTMTIPELEAMELPEVMVNARYVVMFLWRLSAMQLEALRLALSWSLDPAHGELVWRKKTKNGRPWVGMGRILRGSHETAIIACRGAYDPRRPAVMNKLSLFEWEDTFDAKVPVDEEGKYVHSAKPDEFYELLEELWPNAIKVELFARKVRAGWIQHGNQLGSRT